MIKNQFDPTLEPQSTAVGSSNGNLKEYVMGTILS